MSSLPQRRSVTADESLAAAIGADRVLMLRQVPSDLRPAFEALWQIDAAMGDVVARSTQPALAAVKLAWWRERLEELDQGVVPDEPRLQSAAQNLLFRGIKEKLYPLGDDVTVLPGHGPPTTIGAERRTNPFVR